MTLYHRNGGVIEAITAIEHTTYKGVASWEFRGRVKWDDGTVSESAHIAPFHLIQPEPNEHEGNLLAVMQNYLDRNGKWHDWKETRDGRRYAWTPHKPEGHEPYQWSEGKPDAND